ncbi:EspG family protein [Amycolatopsis xylanica]|uniref:EspG family protein n=1 Tax=Amycolatopsis xylanica TaxID=589385 RepID=A0A1H2Y5G3_9PSEU|nr:ESX secretion-associated protein EspG [Amycolatopsis xylanica]SDX00442.1 EspG family protein [Amycolatopsis xylanica]
MWFEKPEQFRVEELAAIVTKTTGGDLHIVLAPQAVWLPPDVKAQADRAVEEALMRYPDDPDERDEPDFKAICELLSRPPEARYGWISDTVNGTKLSVLVAGTSWFGLIAVREGHDVWVRTFHPDRLSLILAEVLPEATAKASGHPISVLRSEMLEAEKTGNGSQSVRRAQRFAELTPHVLAEFNAETRTPGGRRHRNQSPLRVYDTEEGRWTLLIRPHYGDEQLNLAPAGVNEVAALLDELRRELA